MPSGRMRTKPWEQPPKCKQPGCSPTSISWGSRPEPPPQHSPNYAASPSHLRRQRVAAKTPRSPQGVRGTCWKHCSRFLSQGSQSGAGSLGGYRSPSCSEALGSEKPMARPLLAVAEHAEKLPPSRWKCAGSFFWSPGESLQCSKSWHLSWKTEG